MPQESADLDALDIKLIGILSERGYLRNVDLAEDLGLSPSACHQRVARL